VTVAGFHSFTSDFSKKLALSPYIWYSGNFL